MNEGDKIEFFDEWNGRKYYQKGKIIYIPYPESPKSSLLIKTDEGKERIIFPEQISQHKNEQITQMVNLKKEG
jgi:hypothetical protein